MTFLFCRRALLGCCILGALVVAPAASAAMQPPQNAIRPSKIPATGSVVAIAGKTHLDHAEGALVLVDTGTVTGTPYGAGTVTLTYTLHPRLGFAETAFTITAPTGTVSGRAISRYNVGNVSISFTGAGQITGGTGAFAGATSGVLQFNALHSITGKREAIEFVGSTKALGTLGQRAATLQQMLTSANR